MIKTKKTVIAVLVLGLTTTLVGCGGSSNDPSNDNNYNPSIRPSQPQTNYNKDNGKDQVNNSTTFHKFKKESHSDRSKADGRGVKILLSDTGVDLNDRNLDSRNISKTMSKYRKEDDGIYTVPTVETDLEIRHGTEMAKIITKNSPNATIFVSGSEFEHSGLGYGLKSAEIESRRMGHSADIVNMSWGSSHENNGLLDYSNYHGTYSLKEVISKGALLVAATGNDGKSQPIDSSTLPLYDTAFKDSYIAVTGVDMYDRFIDKYNKCGAAKNFCIAGYAYGAYDQKDQYIEFNVRGTSSATAYVSSILSNVKSRYDWMTAKNLKEVLFTTATDAGEYGIDNVFGVGIANKNKAINGYGRFDSPTKLNVKGNKSRYHFDNNISGAGSIIKSGSGTLVLNGNNTFNGNNVINNGELVLNGKNIATTTIKRGGSLSVGDEYVITSGSIINDGKLKSLTPSDFIINGNLTSTGEIHKNIGSKIDVKGIADLNNSKFFVNDVVSGYVTKNGSTEVLLQARRIDGNYEVKNTSKSNLLVSDTIKDSTSISIVTKRNSVQTAAETSSDFDGKDLAIKNIDNLLDKFDVNVGSGTKLTKNEEKLAVALLQSENLNNELFKYSGTTFKNANENLTINELKQNVKFIKNMSSNNNAWIDYDYSKSKLKLNGLNGNGSNNNIEFGYADYITVNSKIGFGISHKDYSWDENMNNEVSKSLKTTGNGFDLGYYYKLDSGYNVYVQIGYNWLKNKNSSSKTNGKQYSTLVGVNKLFKFTDTVEIEPSLSLVNVNSKYNKLSLANDIFVNSVNTKQTSLVLDIDGKYKLNDNISLIGSVGVEQDVNKKSKYNVSYGVNSFDNKDSSIGKLRVNGSVGVKYDFKEKLNIAIMAGHETGKNYNKNNVNATVGYKF